MIKIGITGGIGSGKSTVCRLFSQRGIAVYDCDSEAKRLMMEDETLRKSIQERFGEDTYTDGVLNREVLARKVFGCEEELMALNGLVHPRVRADFRSWCLRQTSPYVILESAILFEAGIQEELDHTLAVLAPESLRVERAMKRDRVSREAILKRIKAQMSDDELAEKAQYVLVNILEEELKGEVERLDKIFRHEQEEHNGLE